MTAPPQKSLNAPTETPDGSGWASCVHRLNLPPPRNATVQSVPSSNTEPYALASLLHRHQMRDVPTNVT